ncbi:hypothetical protein BCR39DRAFT_194898 [Naematelia encephala]|uniref:Uncharacterized protein n=1 Tax=Naematelia encephala TaxID=71784 RepID=A0A1Y2BHP6_9TREE|nr:hypothetical protein BCR39DRAFT_194898 [Naematelia encephala]
MCKTGALNLCATHSFDVKCCSSNHLILEESPFRPWSGRVIMESVTNESARSVIFLPSQQAFSFIPIDRIYAVLELHSDLAPSLSASHTSVVTAPLVSFDHPFQCRSPGSLAIPHLHHPPTSVDHQRNQPCISPNPPTIFGYHFESASSLKMAVSQRIRTIFYPALISKEPKRTPMVCTQRKSNPRPPLTSQLTPSKHHHAADDNDGGSQGSRSALNR